MRVLGFILFVIGLCDLHGLWPLSLIGFMMFEFTGVTWIAASTSHTHLRGGNHGSDNNDHGPMN